MLFAGFVVTQDALLQRVLDDLVGNCRADFFALTTAGQRRGKLACNFMVPRPRSSSASARFSSPTV
jgi:hypothetical protein